MFLVDLDGHVHIVWVVGKHVQGNWIQQIRLTVTQSCNHQMASASYIISYIYIIHIYIYIISYIISASNIISWFLRSHYLCAFSIVGPLEICVEVGGKYIFTEFAGGALLYYYTRS